MRISDWSSDVCSSDLNDLKLPDVWRLMRVGNEFISWRAGQPVYLKVSLATLNERLEIFSTTLWAFEMGRFRSAPLFRTRLQRDQLTHFRSEEQTSELQSLMRISYAVVCLKKKT